MNRIFILRNDLAPCRDQQNIGMTILLTISASQNEFEEAAGFPFFKKKKGVIPPFASCFLLHGERVNPVCWKISLPYNS